MMPAYNSVKDHGCPGPMPFGVTKAAMFTQLTDKTNKSTKRGEATMSPQGVPESCEGTLLQRGPKTMDSYPQAVLSFHTHRPQFHFSYGVVFPVEQLLKGDDQAVWLSSSLLGLTQLVLRTFVRPASVLNTKVKFNVFHAVEFEYIYNA